MKEEAWTDERFGPETAVSRRRAITKLGLGAFVAYAAPLVLNFNQAWAPEGGGGGGSVWHGMERLEDLDECGPGSSGLDCD